MLLWVSSPLPAHLLVIGQPLTGNASKQDSC